MDSKKVKLGGIALVSVFFFLCIIAYASQSLMLSTTAAQPAQNTSEKLEELKDKIASDPEAAFNALLLIGDTLFEQNDLERAERNYFQAVQLNPAHPKPYTQLGKIYAKKGGPRQAMAMYGQAIKQDPNYAEAYFNAAELMLSAGEIETAFNYYKKTAELDPAFEPAIRRLNAITEKLQSVQKATQ